MDVVKSPSPSPAPQSGPGGKLMKNAIAYPGMVFMIIAITAPMTTIASNYSLSLVLGAGTATIGLTIAMVAVFTLFATGYIAISRRVVNAGSTYAFVGHGLGRTAGAVTAMVLTIAYNLAAAAMASGAGFFAAAFDDAYLSLGLPWWAWTGLVFALMVLCGYGGIVRTKLAVAILSSTGFALLVLVGIAIFLQTPGSISVGDVVPIDVPPHAIAFTMVMIATSFAGFESIASYGEETNKTRNIGRAIYTALAVLSIIYVLSTLALAQALESAWAVTDDPGLLLPAAAELYLGSWSGPVFLATAVLSFTAAAVAWHNSAVRNMFAFGRASVLPHALSKVNPRGVPTVAVSVQLALVVAVIAPFAIAGFDPLTGLWPAIGGINAVAYIFGLTMLSVSVFAASVRGRLGDTSMLVGRVAPVIAALCFLVILYYIISNYALIVGSDSIVIKLAPGILIAGAAYAAWAESRKPVTVTP